MAKNITLKETASGTVEVFDAGKRISTGAKDFVQKQYGGVEIEAYTGAPLTAAATEVPPTRPNIVQPTTQQDPALTMTKSEVGDDQSANRYINRFNTADELYKPEDRQGEVRTIAKTLESDLMDGAKAPERISLLDTYKQEQKEAGLDDLSELINDLTAQEKDTQANLRIQKFDEEGKPIAMGVIAGRQSELTRQAREDLDFIQRQKDYAVNEYNSKLSTINTIMAYTEKDYENAVKSYESEFTMKKSMYAMASDIYEAERDEEKVEYDIFKEAQADARANGEIVVNTAITSGRSYDDMSAETQMDLAQWGVQSGLGKDFFKDMFGVARDKPVLTTVLAKDKSTATIIFKDGTTQMVKTGIYDAPAADTDLEEKSTMVNKLREIAADTKMSDVDKMLEMKAAGATDGMINFVLGHEEDTAETAAADAESISEIAQSMIVNNIKDAWGVESEADRVDKSYASSLELLEEAKARGGRVDVPLGGSEFETVVLSDEEMASLESDLKFYASKARGKTWNWLNINPTDLK